MAANLLPLPAFAVHESPASVGPRWSAWLRRFENMMLAMDVTADTRKRARLLYHAGPEVDLIYQTFQCSQDLGTYDFAVSQLNSYFLPQRNSHYETLLFRQARQHAEESIDSFHTRLRQLASTCDFAEVDKEIIMQIICGGTSEELRRRVLREPNIKLPAILVLARSIAQAHTQAQDIERSSNCSSEQDLAINTVKKQSHRNIDNNTRQPSKDQKLTCSNCGHVLPLVNPQRQAKNKKCVKCRKIGHFTRVCR